MAPHTPPETGHASCLWDLFECMEQLSQWIQKKTDSRVFCVTARLDASLPPGGLEMLAEWAEKGLKMIQWHYPKILSQVPSSLLWQTAKTGIWNHVSGRTLFEKGPETVMARFVLNNPHVVHSFELPDDPTFFSSLNAYDTITPLPGKPLWQTLSGPSDILSCLARYSVSHMARLRWDNGILISLGRDIVFHFQPPSDLPPGYLDKVCAMVGAGGSVDLAHVRSNLENAFLIGYAVENGVIVGNSCLKHPRPALV
ncbi:MAG: hypothetical protein K9K21_07650, partial [Desulfotignum sp.]|nr:hypothetical protein [Desulfotignum sp.]